MRYIIVAFVCLFLSLFSEAQDKQYESMDRDQLQRLVNSAFNKLVTSNPSAGEIANYATVDPINAKFSLKSTIPIQPGRRKEMKKLSFEEQVEKDPGYISYLSLSLSGALIDKDYGTLFSNSSLNAGVNLSAQYHFRIGKPKFGYFLEDYTTYDVKRKILRKQHDNSITNLHAGFDPVKLQNDKRTLELSRTSTLSKINKNRNEVVVVTQLIDALGNNTRSRPGLLDTLQKLIQEGDALKKSFDTNNAALDSLEIVGNRSTDFLVIRKNKLQEKYKQDFESLASDLPLQQFRLTWISIIAGYTRKSYNTFDPTQNFDAQFGKGKLDAINFGLAVNHLWTDSLARKTFFFNFSIIRKKDNNLASLSTTSVEQRREIRNAGGDTIRTITGKTSAYTEPIREYKLWNLSLHTYYLFGKTPSGVHISPSVDIKDHEKAITNVLIGYIIPFQNTVKDQPVVNAEIYIKFNDLFNGADDASVFYNRNEVGVSFTFPFKIF